METWQIDYRDGRREALVLERQPLEIIPFGTATAVIQFDLTTGKHMVGYTGPWPYRPDERHIRSTGYIARLRKLQ